MEKLSIFVSAFFKDLVIANSSNKLCLTNSVDKFLKTGRKEDAFSVYFCFCEMFQLFGKGYETTQTLLELLSDHEYHSGELLTKHRDHYSHSVYVFLIGLAIYAKDSNFRNKFSKFYLDDSYEFFLKYWGVTSLFHDIGYPFQLAHEQIKNYNQDIWKNDEKLYVSFGNINAFLQLPNESRKFLKEEFNRDFNDLNELLAYGLYLREGYSIKKVAPLLIKRVIEQPKFLDHGYFSAIILSKKLLKNCSLTQMELDVISAILLHNNFNKYDFKDTYPEEHHRISLNEHPLAYLLLLCDELQVWDRLAYGKISKRDPIAWDIELSIGENFLSATYYFETYTIFEASGNVRMNESYLKIQEGKFVKDIMEYIESPLQIIAKADKKEKERKIETYMSDDNFINLCDFAKAIHASYLEHCLNMSLEHINDSFANLPLEFKLDNIEQAKSYASKLELVNCFYSSKDLDYPIIEDLSKDIFNKSIGDNIGFLSREEHARWVKEKLNLGWKYGTDYTTIDERNSKKIHKSIVPYDVLSDEEKSKDELMVKNLIPLLRKFDSSIKIYNYRFGRKPTLEIAGIGHRFGLQNPKKLKERIKQILNMYKKDYRVVVRTSYAYGADQLIAECAIELGITTKAVLPMEYEEYIQDVKMDAIKHGIEYTLEDELRMRHLLAQTVSMKVEKDPVHTYQAAAAYIINRCEKLIAIWDGSERDLYDVKEHTEINRGGTYHSLCIATKEKGLKLNDSMSLTDIHIVNQEI